MSIWLALVKGKAYEVMLTMICEDCFSSFPLEFHVLRIAWDVNMSYTRSRTKTLWRDITTAFNTSYLYDWLHISQSSYLQNQPIYLTFQDRGNGIVVTAQIFSKTYYSPFRFSLSAGFICIGCCICKEKQVNINLYMSKTSMKRGNLPLMVIGSFRYSTKQNGKIHGKISVAKCVQVNEMNICFMPHW